MSCSANTKLYFFIAYQLIYNLHNLNGIGFSDAIQYCSAFTIWQAGGNPYDDQTMLAVQSGIRPTSVALMMWNPPSLLLVFSPLLSISNYLDFARIWFIASIAAYLCGSWILIDKVAPAHKSDLWLWVLLVTFAPFLSALSFGQLGCWLFLGVALIISGIVASSPIFLALGGILISLKPHLFIVFIISILAILIGKREWKLIIYLCLAPLSVAIMTELISSNEINLIWLKTVLGVTPPLLSQQPQEWATTTIPSVLSKWLLSTDSFLESLLSIIFLILSLVVSLWVTKKYELKIALAFVLLISIPLGPFAWLFDYCVISASLIILWPRLSELSSRLNLFAVSSLILLLLCTCVIKQLDQALLPLLITIGVLLTLFMDKSNLRLASESQINFQD